MILQYDRVKSTLNLAHAGEADKRSVVNCVGPNVCVATIIAIMQLIIHKVDMETHAAICTML